MIIFKNLEGIQKKNYFYLSLKINNFLFCFLMLFFFFNNLSPGEK